MKMEIRCAVLADEDPEDFYADFEVSDAVIYSADVFDEVYDHFAGDYGYRSSDGEYFYRNRYHLQQTFLDLWERLNGRLDQAETAGDEDLIKNTAIKLKAAWHLYTEMKKLTESFSETNWFAIRFID